MIPQVTGVGIFIVLPFCDVVRRSFFTAMTGKFCGFRNYLTIFQNEAFLLAIKNTIKFAGTCLPILILVSLGLSAMIYFSRWSKLMKSALLFPMAVPTAVVVLVWKMLFYREGMLNGMLSALSLPQQDFIGSSAAFFVLVGSYLWKNIGYTVVLWMAGMAGISHTMLEAARVDGASEFRCFVSMILPNLKPVFLTIIILSFLNSFKVFREAYLVAGAYPEDSIYMIQHLFNNWFLKLDVDKMAAAAVCIAGLFGAVAHKLNLVKEG